MGHGIEAEFLSMVPFKQPEQVSDLSGHRFQLAQIPPQHIRNWQACYIIFDQRNGETHLVEGLTSVVLERLLAGPVTRDGLLGEILPYCSEEADNADSFITDVLAELRRHRLIEISLDCSE